MVAYKKAQAWSPQSWNTNLAYHLCDLEQVYLPPLELSFLRSQMGDQCYHLKTVLRVSKTNVQSTQCFVLLKHLLPVSNLRCMNNALGKWRREPRRRSRRKIKSFHHTLCFGVLKNWWNFATKFGNVQAYYFSPRHEGEGRGKAPEAIVHCNHFVDERAILCQNYT